MIRTITALVIAMSTVAAVQAQLTKISLPKIPPKTIENVETVLNEESAWEKLRDNDFQKEDDVEVTAEVYGRAVKRLGRDMIEFKVKVTTKTIGRNRTGRGYATYAVLDSKGKPIVILQAEKYASTDLTHSEKEDSKEEILTVGADAYWRKWDAEICPTTLVARATARVDFPLTTADGIKWFKENISPEIAGAIDKLKKMGAGESIRNGNWSVLNVKKGNLK